MNTHKDKGETKRRYVAIMSGGDWYDASCEHLSIPKGMDLKKEHNEHNEWYRGYCEKMEAGIKPKYYDFTEWLIKRGAKKAKEIEEFFDD